MLRLADFSFVLKGLHSCVAGFVDPGESLDGAVRREVREETGVQVCKISAKAC